MKRKQMKRENGIGEVGGKDEVKKKKKRVMEHKSN